jgi:putative transposase
MATAPYIWRKLTRCQRDDLMAWRKRQGFGWHRPPHLASEKTRYHLTAACFEHRPCIGNSPERLESFCRTLLDTFEQRGAHIQAWCVLPNHYHALVETSMILDVLADLGRMHGRLSFIWNSEEQTRGRQVWCGAAERYMRNDRHFWATINYIHNNPVHHGYVQRWPDWPFSSATEYLVQMGRDEAARIWKEFPILGYGKGWDDPDL